MSGSLSTLLLRRFQQLRTDAGRPEPRTTLLDESLEELATAAEELRVTEEELVQQRVLLAEAWAAAESMGVWQRTMFDGAPDALLLTDRAGNVRDANPAAGHLLGVRRETLRGKPLGLFIPATDRRGFRARVAGMAESARTERFELRLEPRGQQPLWAEAAAAPFRDGAGGTGLHWSLRDVTGRRERDRARDEALETLRLALDAGPEATAVLDVDGSVLHWNRAAERLLGWPEEEVLGRPFPAAAGDAAELPGSASVRTPAGERTVELHVEPIAGADGAQRGRRVVMRPPQPAAPGGARRSPWAERDLVRMVRSHPSTELTERLRDAVAAGVYLGRLAPGDRLPSIRELARQAEVDHRHVSAAYRRLEVEGAIEVRKRYGAVVAERPPACDPPELETAGWVAAVAAEAARLQVKVPQLADLVRRWTCEAAVRCLCVEATEDGRVALVGDMEGRWGFETETLSPDADRAQLGAALAHADVVATTPFHLAQVEPAARAAGVPVVVLTAVPESVEALEQALAKGEVSAVVADPAYGERLRGVACGDRLRVVVAPDRSAEAELDPAQPVLLTRAAQQRIQSPLRLVAPLSPAFSASSAHELASVLVGRSLRAERAGF